MRGLYFGIMGDKDKGKRQLGEMLVEEGLVSRETLNQALEQQKGQGGQLGQILIQQGHLTEEVLVSFLGRQLHLPYVPLNQYAVNAQSARNLEEDFCRENILVLFDADERRASVASSEPLSEQVFEKLRAKLKTRVQIFLSTPLEILGALDLIFSGEKKQPGSGLKKGG